MTLSLSEGDKFSFIAIENVYAELPEDFDGGQLTDGTWVLPVLPVGIGEHWKEWVGTARFDRMTRSNVILMRAARSSNPEVLDQEHEELASQLLPMYHLLQLGGVVEYESADLVKGSMLRDIAEVRQLIQLDGFHPTRGSGRTAVTLASLEKAAMLGISWCSIKNPGEFIRFRRGLDILIDGLKKQHGQDRLHHFVRSLEALILPDVAKTKRQLIHRCQTFAVASAANRGILEESYDLRSDAEHVHEWDKSLSNYRPDEREDIALLRTRQIERLACFAFSRILETTTLQQHFRDEQNMARFWSKDDGARRSLWGLQVDPSTIPLLTEYDGWNRAV